MLVANDEATCQSMGSAARLSARSPRPRPPGVRRCVPMDLGADVARSDQRRRPDRQACATAQPDCGGKPCIRSFGMSVAGSFRWCGRNTGWRLPSNGAVTGPTASCALGNNGRRGWRGRSGRASWIVGAFANWKRPASRGRSVERWLDALDPREAFVARMVVKQVLQTLADDKARPAERFEARRELYRRLRSVGVME